MILVVLAGGIVAGRLSADQRPTSTPAAGTSPGGNGGTVNGGTGNGGTYPGGGGGFPLVPGGGSGNGGSGKGGSSVGAGGGSLNASAIAAKVDPALVDIDSVVDNGQGGEEAGTGIVLTPGGEILTNNHVIRGATKIEVTDIGNGRSYDATIVGTDVTADIAVIQLTGASGLHTANLGNSSSLKVGEPVLALGNAGGVGGTPSTAAGSVVALDKKITATDASSDTSERLSGLVESTAPIQPGDSGGALVNASGQVLAIDTAGNGGPGLDSTSTQAYSIPIDTAVGIAQQIEAGDASSTVHIGEAAILGVEYTAQSGNTIAAVEAGLPAAKAGIVAGDEIVSLNGKSISSLVALSNAMYPFHPGDQVTVGFDTSSGAHETVTLTLVAGPPQ
ncbi:MAG: S1C family serine protease [Acidimicrobiales bacterium]